MVKIFGAAWKCNGSCHIWLMTILFGRDQPNNDRDNFPDFKFSIKNMGTRKKNLDEGLLMSTHKMLMENYKKCTVNFLNIRNTQNICCNHSKIWTLWLYHRVMSPNDADSVDPDQTAPLGAVWSGSALFAQAYLSENLGSLRYSLIMIE